MQDTDDSQMRRYIRGSLEGPEHTNSCRCGAGVCVPPLWYVDMSNNLEAL